jgi:molybdate transport system ATP-binding protein
VTLVVDLMDRRGDFQLDAAFATGAGVTALFGRSGAGKTTIVSMVAGLLRPQAGSIVINGRTLYDSARRIDVPAPRRRIGMVFQEARLFPHLSVRANLLYGRWAGRRPRDTRFEDIIELLGLENLLARRPASLSGGEAQRVAIGRALLAAPEILLMDEPLSQLDGARRAEILPFLERLSKTGVPILYVSHAIDEVARLADEIVVLNEGRVAAVGPVGDVLGRIDLSPATGRYEAGALLFAVVVGEDVEFALTKLRLGAIEIAVPALHRPIGDSVRLRVRARDVAIALKAPEATSIRNVIVAEVAAIDREAGAFCEVLLAVGGERLRARITRKSAEELGLRIGQPVYALVKSIAVEAGPGALRR